MAKINWIQAQGEYVADESLSYQDIAEKYGVSRSQVIRVATKEGWQALRLETKQNAAEMLPKKAGEALTDVTARHIQTAKILQTKGLQKIIGDPTKNIPGTDPENFSEARQAVKDGVDIERKAYGLDKPERPTQINIFNMIEKERQKYGR